MDQGPLVAEQLDAAGRFLAEFDRTFPVRVAFWVKNVEGGYWDLYVASDRVSPGDTRTAYLEVLRIANEMNDPHFDPFQVRVIGADSPTARAAIDWLRRHPGIKAATPFHEMYFGDITVEQGYLYPSPVAVA